MYWRILKVWKIWVRMSTSDGASFCGVLGKTDYNLCGAFYFRYISIGASGLHFSFQKVKDLCARIMLAHCYKGGETNAPTKWRHCIVVSRIIILEKNIFLFMKEYSKIFTHQKLFSQINKEIYIFLKMFIKKYHHFSMLRTFFVYS